MRIKHWNLICFQGNNLFCLQDHFTEGILSCLAFHQSQQKFDPIPELRYGPLSLRTLDQLQADESMVHNYFQ